MFLRSALHEHGVTGGDHPYAARFWFLEEAGEIQAALSLTTNGALSVQIPDLGHVPLLAPVLRGEKVGVCTGACAQVHAVLNTLGLAKAPMQLLRDEPLYTLALTDLAARPAPLTLRPGQDYDLPMLAIWRAQYNRETLGQDGPDLEDRALEEVRRHILRGHLRILEDAGTPVAMTNFNATLPDMVQIGGVYTPSEFRGRGYAREAVARHLLEMRGKGVAHAVLFASGPSASKAYEAIGFAHVGCYTLAILTEPREVLP